MKIKKTLLTLSTFLLYGYLFGQDPSIATPKEDDINYSNNAVLTNNDMVFNRSFSPIRKVPLDTNSILIYDYDGTLFSYNLKTNNINWDAKASDPDRKLCGNELTLKDGVVYVPFINGEIYALNNQTGKLFWRTRLGNLKEDIIIKNQIPTIVGRNIYITTQYGNSNIYALDIDDGSLVWNYKLDFPYNHNPVLYFDDKVFTSSAPYFYNFDAITGKALYRRGFEEAMYSKPVTDNKNVFIANEHDMLYALNPNNLDILWEYRLHKNQSHISRKIFVKDKKIYLGTHGRDTSSVYSLHSESGQLIWKSDFKDEDIDYILEYENALWGYTEKGLFFKIDLLTGNKIIEKQLKNVPISNIEFVDSNTLFFYCEAGLIKLDIEKDMEELVYIRNTIDTDPGSAYIKLIK